MHAYHLQHFLKILQDLFILGVKYLVVLSTVVHLKKHFVVENFKHTQKEREQHNDPLLVHPFTSFSTFMTESCLYLHPLSSVRDYFETNPRHHIILSSNISLSIFKRLGIISLKNLTIILNVIKQLIKFLCLNFFSLFESLSKQGPHTAVAWCASQVSFNIQLIVPPPLFPLQFIC